MDYGEHAEIDLQFQPHLQSSDLPGREILEEAASSKARLLIDLQFLDKEILALQKRRNTVKDNLRVFDCILAPIRRLSEDVLAEIFCHCIPTTRNARPFVSEAPLLLTLVCKTWRIIATSTPRLWTTLHIPAVFIYSPRVRSPNRSTLFGHQADAPIPADLPHNALYAARDAGLDQWLSMSASLPLSISLYDAFSAQASPSNLRRATLHLIARYAERISALEADVPQKVLNELESYDFVGA
ncbi:hypothetical protein BJ165DRAFT_256460 [Panaeolus papilionaceus]|nr:hypothetical protein BJ165DRAFT_256460 [Panaeolus papilionaceus]